MSNANDILAAAREGVHKVLEVDQSRTERELVLEIHERNDAMIEGNDLTFLATATLAAILFAIVFLVLVRAYYRRRGETLARVPLDFAQQRQLVKQAGEQPQ